MMNEAVESATTDAIIAQSSVSALIAAPPLPTEGYVRLATVLSVLPIKKTAWWDGIKDGRYPPGVKLGPKVTAWRVTELRALMAALDRGASDIELKALVRELVAARTQQAAA